MLHQHVANFLREEVIPYGGESADGDENFVRGGEPGEGGGQVAADFAEDGHGVRELAFGEVGEVDVDDRVAGGAVVGEGGVAGVQDGGIGDVEVGFVNSDCFGVGW